MNSTEMNPISGVPRAAGNLDVARQSDPREDLPLEANQQEPVEELGELNADRGRASRRAQSKRRQEAEAKRSGLPDDPFLCIGMKIRRKKDGAIFTVRSVFKNQRVELEKNWMTYTSDVAAIQAGFEPYI